MPQPSRRAFRGPAGLPGVLILLIAVTAVASIGGAILGRNGVPVAEWFALIPHRVWQGEVWRLVTWVFFEGDPLSLIFSCLMIFWFGRDLVGVWGPRRLVGVYVGVAAVVGASTVLIGRFLWPEVWSIPHARSSTATLALVMAWSCYFRDREILFMFVARVSGAQLIWITMGGTVLFALFLGFAGFVPHFLAEAFMLAYAGQARRWYLEWKLARLQRKGSSWDFGGWLKKQTRRRYRVLDGGRGKEDKPKYMN